MVSRIVAAPSGVKVGSPRSKKAAPQVSYQRSTSSLLSRRSRAAIRSCDQPNDQRRSHGCFLRSSRLTSSRLKKRHEMSSSVCHRTSRIQIEERYAHGHIGSKKN